MTKTIGVTDDWGDISLATNMVVLRDEVSPATRLPIMDGREGRHAEPEFRLGGEWPS